jgi:citrate lyase subunit beta/citryl-CoA lyase
MQAIRSLLFVPGDSERKIAKGLASAADALILDLEDSVSPDRRPAARRLVYATLSANKGDKKLFVRINAFDTPDFLPDLVAIISGGPFGVMLPKCPNAQQVLRLADMLTALEARDGISPGQTRILPIVTETAASMFGLGSYAEISIPRVYGMLWGGDDLSADLGATANREEDGHYTTPYRLARSLCLLAATAAGVAPVDAVFTDFRDLDGLQFECTQAAKGGFVAKAAIHPDQIDIINRTFTPTEAELDWARKVVAAFDAAPGAAVVGLDGKMLDRPHQKAASRVLARGASSR